MQKPNSPSYEDTGVDAARIAAIAARYKDEPDQLMRILLEIQSCCGNSIPFIIPAARLCLYLTSSKSPPSRQMTGGS